MFGDVRISFGQRIERGHRIRDAMIIEAVVEQPRVAGAALLTRDTAALGTQATIAGGQNESFRGEPRQEQRGDGDYGDLPTSHGRTVMRLRPWFQLPKLGPCQPRALQN